MRHTDAVYRRSPHLCSAGRGRADGGTRSQFFALGGDSLQAGRIVARIDNTFGSDLSLLDLIQHPTVGELARLLDGEPPSCRPLHHSAPDERG